MRRFSLLLAAVALPLAIARPVPALATEPVAPFRVAQAEDRVAAARASLEKAEASLQQAEETGGDIRAARISLANALKSLRAAELAAGATPTPAPAAAAPAPAAAAPAAAPAAPAPAVRTVGPPAPTAPADPQAPAGPKPYVPPTIVEKPAPKKPSAAAEAEPAKPPAAPKPKAPAVAKPRSPQPVIVRRGAETETTTTHADGSSTIDLADRNGRLIRRIEVDRRGNEVVVIDRERRAAAPRYVDPMEVPPPPGYEEEGYVLNGDSASEEDIESTLDAAPIQRPMRGYSLNEIRRDGRIRDMVRRVDLDTITFESGSSRVPDDQVRKLRTMGRALGRMLDRRPDQVFLIEGHTDAVGTRLANLELSDRRAASVAVILTEYFGIPPRNLVAQGYGEDQLKVPTEGPDRQNRRVTIRNITPLLSRGG